MHFKYQSYVILTWQTKQYHTYGTVISSSVTTSSRKIQYFTISLQFISTQNN